jgi:hypothetical protein
VGRAVSGATYRIETEHSPGAAEGMEWQARVYALTDEYFAEKCCYSSTEHGAEQLAREWIRFQNEKQTGRTFYVFDDGTDAPEPDTHSVKA